MTGLAKLYQCKAHADFKLGKLAFEERLADILMSAEYEFTIEVPSLKQNIYNKGSFRFVENKRTNVQEQTKVPERTDVSLQTNVPERTNVSERTNVISELMFRSELTFV